MDSRDDKCHFEHAVYDVYRTTRKSYLGSSYMYESEIQGRNQC